MHFEGNIDNESPMDVGGGNTIDQATLHYNTGDGWQSTAMSKAGSDTLSVRLLNL